MNGPKGRPCVHDDDDLIVSHIAVTVSNMVEFKQRLAKLNVVWRKNVSVPNPAESDTGIVEQVLLERLYTIKCFEITLPGKVI